MPYWRRKKKVLAQLEALVRRAKQAQPTPQKPAQPTVNPQQQSAPNISQRPAQMAGAHQTAGGATAPTGGSLFARMNRIAAQGQADAQKTQVQQDTPQQQIIPIDKNAMLMAWKEFANSLPISDNYLRTIMATEPTCNGCEISVEIITPSQNMICEHEGLISFLRARLNNPGVVIKTRLVEQKEESAATPFTAKQKLDALIGENKNLSTLIERFGLSFDY